MTRDRPARWLMDHQHLLPRSGDALDVACGAGRNAFWLAERGLRVRAVDRNGERIEVVAKEGRRRGLDIDTEVIDLESGTVSFGTARYDAIVVFHYLHRPLFPALVSALRHGGVLVYETFTRGQATRGKPTNPAYLLEEGELRELVWPLEVMVEREGDFEGRWIASIVARRVRATD